MDTLDKLYQIFFLWGLFLAFVSFVFWTENHRLSKIFFPLMLICLILSTVIWVIK